MINDPTPPEGLEAFTSQRAFTAGYNAGINHEQMRIVRALPVLISDSLLLLGGRDDGTPLDLAPWSPQDLAAGLAPLVAAAIKKGTGG